MNGWYFILGAATGALSGVVGSCAFAGIIVKVMGSKLRGLM